MKNIVAECNLGFCRIYISYKHCCSAQMEKNPTHLLHLEHKVTLSLNLHLLPGQVSGLLTHGGFLSPLPSALPFHSAPPPHLPPVLLSEMLVGHLALSRSSSFILFSSPLLLSETLTGQPSVQSLASLSPSTFSSPCLLPSLTPVWLTLYQTCGSAKPWPVPCHSSPQYFY